MNSGSRYSNIDVAPDKVVVNINSEQSMANFGDESQRQLLINNRESEDFKLP